MTTQPAAAGSLPHAFGRALMATDLERFIVSLEASTTKFNNAFNKANQTARKQLGDIQMQFKETNKKLSEGLSFSGSSVGGLQGGIDSLKTGAAGFAGALTPQRSPCRWRPTSGR
ncbi:hypothetical protein [Mesorhizobium captivum]|uniref:hypothetical protein n=1 Tax=Mesorhizobium captivum TaxID=3072319 RepID=UPI002A23EF1F|nr:hypothetical protein [Mesorhizobium sp. VK22E]MDX8509791.1 hypothetical protein [Mesorhizobium sp. VK22E]